MLQIIKVTGDSLYPEICQGDFVLISKIPFCLNNLHVGDIIVFLHPVFGTMIKRIEQVNPEQKTYFVVGTNSQSIDSRHFGAIEHGAISGKVIWHISARRANAK